MPENGLVVLEP